MVCSRLLLLQRYENVADCLSVCQSNNSSLSLSLSLSLSVCVCVLLVLSSVENTLYDWTAASVRCDLAGSEESLREECSDGVPSDGRAYWVGAIQKYTGLFRIGGKFHNRVTGYYIIDRLNMKYKRQFVLFRLLCLQRTQDSGLQTEYSQQHPTRPRLLPGMRELSHICLVCEYVIYCNYNINYR